MPRSKKTSQMPVAVYKDRAVRAGFWVKTARQFRSSVLRAIRLTLLVLAGLIAIDVSLGLGAVAIFGIVAAAEKLEFRLQSDLGIDGRFERIAMSLRDGLVCVDKNGRITLWNRGASSIFGYSENAATGQFFEFLLADNKDFGPSFKLTEVPLASLQQRGSAAIELMGRRSSGEAFDLECSISIWQAPEGPNYGVVLRDIAARKREQEHIRYLAEWDTTTGLPNRNNLMARLAREFAQGRPDDLFLLLVEVNKFQQINNLHGHSFGDALLTTIASRLRLIAPQAKLTARLGSEEFALLFTEPTVNPTSLGQFLVEDFQARPVFVGEHQHRITVSVGYARATDASDPEQLLGNAHFALAEAKVRKSQSAVPFDLQMRAALERREALEVELRAAFADNQFELFYQPQFDMRTNVVVGAEALIRWRHRERGYISPGEFMPIVNTTSLSEDVAGWVLETACRRAADWQRRGYSIRIGVNLSQSQFASGDLAGDVKRLITENGLRPELLELEVTEDIILDDVTKTLRVLSKLREIGVKIAFDDFGTGYGSLTYLKTFPLDKIKIDQSFVKNLRPNTEDAAIVAATTKLGQALGLTVIAEGIETESIAEILRQMGCNEGQGYLMSKPIPARQFEATFLSKKTQMVA